MEEARCAAHLFTYNEYQALPMKDFFSQYKNSFPMLAVVIDGHYGDTAYDCFENFQVIRIHGYSTQPRVFCTDRKSAHATNENYYTLPLNTERGFQKVLGHSSVNVCGEISKWLLMTGDYLIQVAVGAVGEIQTLAAIVNENELPVLIRMANASVRVGTGVHSANDLGNLLVQEKYNEHYLMVNCIDTTAFSQYDIHEENPIYEVPGFSPVKHKPDPPTKDRKPEFQIRTGNEDDDDSSGDYEQMDEAPVLPPRTPKSPTTSPNDAHDITKPKKGIQKKLKGFFGSKQPKDKSSPDHDRKHGHSSVSGKTHDGDIRQQVDKPHKPYVNANMRQAVVKPMPSRKDRSPQTLPTPTTEYNADDTDPYNRVYAVPNEDEYSREEEKEYIEEEDDDDIYIVADVHDDDKYLESKLATLPKTPTSSNTVENQRQKPSLPERPTANAACSNEIIPPMIPARDNQTDKNIASMTIGDVSEVLKKLNLGKYVEAFREDQIDGDLLTQLSVEDLITDLQLRKVEALRLSRYIETGRIPK